MAREDGRIPTQKGRRSMKNAKGATAKDIFEVFCEHGESVSDAAKRVGYVKPLYRVGVTALACHREREYLIAKARAGRYGLGFPVFARKGWEEVTN